MNTLREEFEELAGAAGPPSRLSADEVYAAAWRRRRWHTSAWLAGGLATGLLATGLGVAALHHPSGAELAQPLSPAAPYGDIQSAVATGAGHLYATVRICTPKPCVDQLLGSDDNGATWSVRQPAGIGPVLAPAPGVLMQTLQTVNQGYDGSPSSGPKLFNTARISTDGGRTWRDVQPQTGTVAAMPPGGWVECGRDLSIAAPGTNDPYDNCRLVAINPATATASVLANQPDLDYIMPVNAPTSAGIWVTGRSHGDNRYPAVAVSHDQGRSWTVHTIGTDEADFPSGSTWGTTGLLTIDGSTAYVLIQSLDPNSPGGPTTPPGSGSAFRIYRTTDGGQSWHRIPAARPLPQSGVQLDQSYLAGDGTPVILADENQPQQWYTGGDGGSAYAPAHLPGLGNDLTLSGVRPLVQIVMPRLYVTFDSTSIYRSTDGLHWTQIMPATR